MHRSSLTACAYVQSKAVNKRGYLIDMKNLFPAHAIATRNLDKSQSPALPRIVLQVADGDHDEEGLCVSRYVTMGDCSEHNSGKEN